MRLIFPSMINVDLLLKKRCERFLTKQFVTKVSHDQILEPHRHFRCKLNQMIEVNKQNLFRVFVDEISDLLEYESRFRSVESVVHKEVVLLFVVDGSHVDVTDPPLQLYPDIVPLC